MTKQEEILSRHFIGVNMEKIKSHHDFLPSVIKAMDEHAKLKCQKQKAIDANFEKPVDFTHRNIQLAILNAPLATDD